MRQFHRTLLVAGALAAVVGILALGPLLPPPSVGHAAESEAAQVSLEGKQVSVLLAHSPSQVALVEDISGTITEVNDHGLMLDATRRSVVKQGRRSDGEYSRTVFIPWTSVLYIKMN